MNPQNTLFYNVVNKYDSSYIKVKLENIIYVKSEGNYLEVMEDGDKKYIIRITLKDFIKYLPKDLFLRAHNSYVINSECKKTQSLIKKASFLRLAKLINWEFTCVNDQF